MNYNLPEIAIDKEHFYTDVVTMLHQYLDLRELMHYYVEHKFVLFTLQGINMTTSKKEASRASKILSNPESSKAEKSVAASDLAQAKIQKRTQKKSK